MRKEKSLKELERTEEKLKQIIAVLRERNNYMKIMLPYKSNEINVVSYKKSLSI